MKIVTHNGHFHTDDLLAVSTLLLKFPDAEVIRTRDQKEIDGSDMVVDVGQIYDESKLRFDHHQPEGAGKRENGIPYASFGLVWKTFGKELSGGEVEARIIDERLVMSVDAPDNGVTIYGSNFPGVNIYTVGDYFESFVETEGTMESLDEEFFKALPLAKELLEREIRLAKKRAEDLEAIRNIYKESPNKEIIILPFHKHWKKALIPTEAKYVIFPRPDGLWSARAVPVELGGFEVKKTFPQSWAGLKDGELAEISGVYDAVFCHRDIWLANAKTKEAAIKLAELALNA